MFTMALSNNQAMVITPPFRNVSHHLNEEENCLKTGVFTKYFNHIQGGLDTPSPFVSEQKYGKYSNQFYTSSNAEGQASVSHTSPGWSGPSGHAHSLLTVVLVICHRNKMICCVNKIFEGGKPCELTYLNGYIPTNSNVSLSQPWQVVASNFLLLIFSFATMICWPLVSMKMLLIETNLIYTL